MHTEILIVTVLVFVIAALVICTFHREFTLQEGCTGLLYRHGAFVEALAAGRHVRWGRGFNLTPLDLRQAFLEVSGQEVLTADNVGLKVSLLVTYQIADPVKALHSTQHWNTDLYHATQLALRTVAGRLPVEVLLAQRATLAPQLLALVQPDAAKIGVTVHAVEAKDVMFPAELKRAFTEALKAKQEGQAALERARGETAALRSLANAARMLDGNPALMNLRLLQSLTTAQAAGSTLVMGVPGGFVPLKNGKAALMPEVGETKA